MSNPIIEIKVKEYGTMTAELYPDKAPLTVANFLKLAKEDFFAGLIFHRVIKGFMIQGGGMDEEMNPKKCATVKGEFTANGCRTNDLPHTRGVLSMARTQVPDSASSQFFVMHADAPYLDGNYAGFGMLTDGFDVLDRIATTRTGSVGWYDDVPMEPVVIEHINVISE